MNILIKPKKNLYIIYAIIISLFTTIGMSISLMNTNADAILKRMEYNSVWSNFMVVFKLSLSGKLGMKFFNQIVVAVIFLLFLIIFSYHFSIREIVSSAIVSGIFGFCMWFRTVFAHKESWNYFL